MTQPIESIAAVLEAMDSEVERCVECSDVRGNVAVVYRAVTEPVRERIGAGEFADCERIERFAVLFARR